MVLILSKNRMRQQKRDLIFEGQYYVPAWNNPMSGLYKKEQATPCWVDIEKIDKIYTMRDVLNKKWNCKFEVDHVIPLAGELVSGLHVWENLQLLDKSLNAQKSNKYNIE